MKRILRLDEDDITKAVAEYFHAHPDQVTSMYIDEEGVETKFYIEIEIKGDKIK